jgi:hypothetical protein
MHRRVRAAALLSVVFATCVSAPVRGDDGPDAAVAPTPVAPTAAAVDAAVDRGVAALRDEQKRDGSFGTLPGETALALLALRHSGVPADDPACRRAASNLERELPDGTVYGAGLGVVALLEQDAKLHGRKVEELVADLVRGQCENGQWTYAYRATSRKPSGDNSNTQFAILALGVARARDVKVPPAPFAACAKFLDATQNDDGGWGYSDKERSRSYGSMTAGGAMALAFCRAAARGVALPDAEVAGDARIVRAVAWLGRKFAPEYNADAGRSFGKKAKNRTDSFWRHYWLWSVERAGAVTGLSHVGTHEWYSLGAAHLLATQRDDGAWMNPETQLRATCFALLFLRRSTRQAITPSSRSQPVVTPGSADAPEPPSTE